MIDSASSYHTYAQNHADGGRLCRSIWERCTPAQAAAATLRYDDEAIILIARDQFSELIGLTPLGMGVK